MSKNTELQKVADLFTQVRRELELSQTEFAKRLKISQPTLSKIERCVRDPRGSLVIRVIDMKDTLKALKAKVA